MVTPDQTGVVSSAMNARTIGSGSETIVLAHGFGTDQTIWDKVVPLLAQHYRVVVFDWPFCGALKQRTMFDPLKYCSFEPFADDVISLMDELEVESSTFIGHSMSAMIGCIASLKRPHLFTRLILLCASPRYLNVEGYEGGFRNSDVEGLLAAIESDYESWVSGFTSIAIDPNDVVSREKFRELLLSMGGDVALPLAKTVFAATTEICWRR
ncbi:putative strigolactone esterase DAD2 [Senna tora]|uniref:Putative strigolactone esterase DAD2 n=1 Tax=Senna tora TaxID=362788 RepID=A0A834VX65_9FABA|nr:putative strigolactone esterase DAD2 [Senna tora]